MFQARHRKGVETGVSKECAVVSEGPENTGDTGLRPERVARATCEGQESGLAALRDLIGCDAGEWGSGSREASGIEGLRQVETSGRQSGCPGKMAEHTGTRFLTGQGDAETASSRKLTPCRAFRLPWRTRQGQARNNPGPPGPEEPPDPSTTKGRGT